MRGPGRPRERSALGSGATTRVPTGGASVNPLNYRSDFDLWTAELQQLFKVKSHTLVVGSRFQNGVSRIHGDVSALILGELWPEVPEQENPVTYVTNGVHVPSFLAPEWVEAFDRFVGSGWHRHIDDPSVLDAILEMPDHVFWSVRQHLKARMLTLVRQRDRRAVPESPAAGRPAA